MRVRNWTLLVTTATEVSLRQQKAYHIFLSGSSSPVEFGNYCEIVLILFILTMSVWDSSQTLRFYLYRISEVLGKNQLLLIVISVLNVTISRCDHSSLGCC